MVILLSSILSHYFIYKHEENFYRIMIYDIILLSSILASILLFIIYFLNLKKVYEMQNMFFSASLKYLTKFFLIIDNKGKIIYCDNNSEYNLRKITNFKAPLTQCNIFDIFKNSEIHHILRQSLSFKYNSNFFIYNNQKICINSLDKPYDFFCIYILSGIANYFDNSMRNILKTKKISRVCTDVDGYLIKKFNENIEINDDEKVHISQIFTPKSDVKGIIHNVKDNIESVFYNTEEAFFNKEKIFIYLFQEINISDIDELHKSPIITFNTDLNGDILAKNKIFKEAFGDKIKNISEIIEYKQNIKLSNLPNPLLTSLINGNYVRIYSLISHNIITFYIIDNSEIVHLQNQLSHSQKVSSIGQLAGGIAHDFNNILTGILGFCDLLIEKDAKNSNIGEIIEIRNNAQRGTYLVAQIMSFARKQSLKPKVCNLNTVLSNTTKFLSQVIGENINFDIKYDKNLWFVKIDDAHFQQIIVNLIINSKDALEDINNAFIKIRTYNKNIISKDKNEAIYDGIPVGEYVAVSIHDNGYGIKKENIEKIFNPFYTTKSTGKGTGLGLSTVYGLVNQMQGYIKVNSDEKGGKTIFYIYFPRSHDSSVIEIDNKDQINNDVVDIIDNENNNVNIMIVEDEKSVRLLLEKFLIKHSYNVITVESSKDAVEYFRSLTSNNNNSNKKIDLIISDVIMPDLNGPEMIKQIFNIFSDIKVLFISGYSNDLLKDKNIPIEFQHIAKPFAMKELLKKIKDMTVEKV
ncbi:response regulator [Anaplasmataceae bacterium AB001_6]|nr:response regulator [Anaplasmataceae bacterium AB001_6]